MFFKMFLIGTVQGLTEFLPVSSSGHLVVIQELLNIHIPGIGLEIVVHLATAIAVIIFFWSDFLKIFDFRGKWTGWLLTLIIIGTIPPALFGYLLDKPIEKAFETAKDVRWFFIINSFILALSLLAPRKNKELTPLKAFLIGIAETFALFPGISRSGITITAALLLGLEPQRAFSFSFLLALPAIFGAAFLKAFEGGFSNLSGSFVYPAFSASLIFGIIALILLRKVVLARKLHYFGIYTFLLGFLLFFLPLP